MTEIALSSSPAFALNRRGDQQVSIGYLTKLTIGSNITLTADVSIASPDDPTSSTQVAALLTKVTWGGQPSDPISLEGVVSTKNKHAVGNISPSSLANTQVVTQFCVWMYDPVNFTYFQAFHTGGADVTGYVKTKAPGSRGLDLDIRFGSEPAADPKSPQVFPFSLSLVPIAQAMSLHVATANLQVYVTTWGIAPPS